MPATAHSATPPFGLPPDGRAGRLASSVPILAGAAGAVAVACILIAYRTSPSVPLGLLVLGAALARALTRPLDVAAVAIALIPLEFFALPVGGGGISATEAMFALAGLGWAARRVREGRSLRPGTPLDGPVVLLLISVIPGLLLAGDPGAVGRVLAMWTAFAFVLAAIATDARPADVRRLLWLLAAAGAATAIIAIVRSGGNPIELDAGDDVAVNRAVGAFSDPNVFGTLLALALPAAIAWALIGRARWRPFAAGAGVAILVALGLSLSRGGLLAAAAALLVLLLWQPFRRLAIPAVLVLAVVTLAGANPLSRVEQVDTVVQRIASIQTSDQSVSDQRLQLYRTTPQIIADHPLFGVGENQYSAVAPGYGLIDPTTGYTFDHAHNVVLTIGAELGVLGLAALLWIAVVTVGLLRRACARAAPERALGVVVAAALTALAVQGMVDYTLRSNVIAALAALLGGCAVVLARPTAANR